MRYLLEQRSGRHCPARTSPLPFTAEHLEPRLVLSAPFAAVGFHFDPTHPSVYAASGDRADDGSLTGMFARAQVGAPAAPEPLPWATFDLMSHGRLTSTPANGASPFDTQLGAGYAWNMGFPAGFLTGQTAAAGGGTSDDISYLIERQSAGPITVDGFGSYIFKNVTLGPNGVSIVSGRFFFSSDLVTVHVMFDGGSAQGVDVPITMHEDDGTLHLGNGWVIYVSASGSPVASTQGGTLFAPGFTALIADTDGTDGTVAMGIAFHGDPSTVFGRAGLNGVYRTTITTPDADAGAFFSARPTSQNTFIASIALELDPHGLYRIYDLANYDAGIRTVLSSGMWDVNFQSNLPPDLRNLVDPNTLRLVQDGTNRSAGLAISQDFSLQPIVVLSQDQTTLELVSGLSTRLIGLPTESTTTTATVSLDNAGRPIFYEFDRTSVSDFNDNHRAWFSVDLIDRAGGSPLRTVTSVSTSGFSNPHFVVAGITTSGEAVAWERSSNGSWTFRNLSEDTQSPLIASDNAVFQITFTDNTIGPFAQLPGLAIAGKTGGGDIVIYQIFNGPDTFGLVQWMFTNITAAGLAPFGETTPDWVGPVTGYGTRWGGLNIAGHDAAGHVWVVWTSADQPHWFQNDLTDNSGGPATTGPISVTVTPWNTIHIHTLDSAGNLIVTWWSPTFGAHWEFNNLTAEIGGPALTPAAGVLSFLGIDNSLNVAAADGSGNIRIYWWRPDSFMWQAGNTTPDLDPADRPTTLSSASVAPESDPSHMVQFGAAQNIFGRTAGDHFVRLHWNNFGPDIWSFEDITAAEMVLPT